MEDSLTRALDNVPVTVRNCEGAIDPARTVTGTLSRAIARLKQSSLCCNARFNSQVAQRQPDPKIKR